MKELPSSWTAAPLKELTSKVGSGATPRGGGESYKSSGTPLIRSMNVIMFGFKREGLAYLDEIQSQVLKNVEVHAGDVLLNITGASIGRVTLAPPDLQGARVNQHVCIVRPTEVLDARYLGAYLSSASMQAEIGAEHYGMTRQALTKQQILDFEIPIPPRAEQTRIAHKIETLVGKVKDTRGRVDRLQAISKKFREAVLEAAVSGRLTEEWRRNSNVGTWLPVTIADVCSAIFDGPFGSNLKSADYSDSGVRVVRLENIGHLQFIGDRETYVPRKKYIALQKHSLTAGDVMFSSFVDEEVRVCLVPPGLGTSINKADCFCLRIEASKALPSFVAYRLATAKTYRNIKELVHGATRPRINLSQLRSYPIELPPLDEQREIVRLVDNLFAAADTLQRRYNDVADRVAKLMPSLLAKAFRGELVPQDPSDEPAEEMLARAKYERREVGMTTKKRLAIRTGRAAIIEAPDKVTTVAKAEKYILTPILKKQGCLSPEALLQSSGLGIDEFYEQLKIEESKGLLKEVRKGKGQIDRWIEAVK